MEQQADSGRMTAKSLAAGALNRRFCVEFYVEAECATSDLAAHAGCTERTVRKVFALHGIPLRTVRGWHRRAGASNPTTLADVLTYDYLYAEYLVKRRTMTDIAAEHGCSGSSVGEHLLRVGIPTRGKSMPLGVGAVLTRELLEDEYVHVGMTTGEIARRHRCSSHAVEEALRRHRIPARPSPSVPSPARDTLTPAFLEREYLLRGRSAKEIGAQLGCSQNVVLDALRKHGFPVLPSQRRRAA